LRLLPALLTWLIPGCGFAAALTLLLSPWVVDRLSMAMDDTVRVEAQVTTCVPRRDGLNKRNAVVCRFHYDYAGEIHETESPAWDSRSPFLTSAGLARELALQSSRTSRAAEVPRRHPAEARLVDQRPLAMPPLWLWLLGLFIALMVAAFRLDPSGIPHRRAELTPDPVTGHLVSIDHRRRNRLRRRIEGQCLAGAVTMAICLYGLSNRPADLIGRAGMTALRPVPARLFNCTHQHHGGYRGNEQIDCDFAYRAGGAMRIGQAESLDFRLFPTNARMNAEIARLPDGMPVTAHVDPRRPDYAWASIREDAFVPFTWGLFELELWIILAAIAAGLIASIGRWRRPDGAVG